MIEVYSQVRTAFTASEQPHYQFTPRDLTQWVAGLRRYDYEPIRWEWGGYRLALYGIVLPGVLSNVQPDVYPWAPSSAY